MLVSVWVQTTFDFSAKEVYQHLDKCGNSLSNFMKRYGPVPGVLSTEILSGNWGEPGSKRLVHMDDGSTAMDHMLRVDAPHFFSYEVVNFTSMLRLLVDKVYGEWNLDEVGGKTFVKWTYQLQPKSIIFVPFLYLFSIFFVKPYLFQTLMRMKAAFS